MYYRNHGPISVKTIGGLEPWNFVTLKAVGERYMWEEHTDIAAISVVHLWSIFASSVLGHVPAR
jgi:hypothetical protein